MWRARDARVAQQQSQRGHAAHRIADHAGQALDAERAHHVQRRVGAVLDRQFGEIEPIQVAGRAD